MSDHSDSSLRTDCSQGKSIDKCEKSNLDTAEELLKLQCGYYRRMNALLSLEAAERFGTRLDNLSEGAYMPASGSADVATIAGLLNLDQRSVFDQLKKTQHEQLGFGRTVFYSLANWFLAKRIPAAKPKRPKK